MRIFAFFLTCFLAPVPAIAQTPNGQELSLLWGLPFVLILLSLALFPLINPKIWHKHYGIIVGAIGLGFFGAFAGIYGVGSGLDILAEAVLHEYIPFVSLLFALFTISGGIRITGPFTGTPKSNVLILVVGSLLASVIGTTGASMLLITVLLRANKWRTYQRHTVIFFIFLVANIGGCLSPLGDPPLFLGYLHGVPFFWPLQNLSGEFLIIVSFLMALYYGLDRYYYSHEIEKKMAPLREPLRLYGKRNIPLLLGVICLVLASGLWKDYMQITVLGVEKAFSDLARDMGLIAMGVLSILVSKQSDREKNHFSWEPIIEIAKIFFFIFLTVTPVVMILHAGTDGALAPLINLSHTAQGPNNFAYFWLSGLLSSFLDNAPTYLVFFHMAGGEAAQLTGALSSTLQALSFGAVFMGAMTYIGNAPNFMVRSIAEERGIKMPSFFGYMLWSFGILGPLFLVFSLFL
jgi:Na+/H+ antiporter NhaD/arsenite permease-like protein